MEEDSKQNNEEERDIDVISEGLENVRTYSKSLTMDIFKDFSPKSNDLTIPYKVIRKSKHARNNNVREIILQVFNRPDKSLGMKAKLDLWGFESYSSYLYTICELNFLEGLIPVVDFGFLSPDEIKYLREVVAVFKTPLYCDVDCYQIQSGYTKKGLNYREKVFEWVNKLKYTSATGFFMHKGIDKQQVIDWIDHINSYLNTENSAILRLEIAFMPRFDIPGINLLSDDEIKDLYLFIKERLNVNLSINFLNASLNVNQFLFDNGEKDFGSIEYNSPERMEMFKALNEYACRKDCSFLSRFPITKDLILNEKYSKKLSQVFDAYRYKIKKDIIEKQKEFRA